MKSITNSLVGKFVNSSYHRVYRIYQPNLVEKARTNLLHFPYPLPLSLFDISLFDSKLIHVQDICL